MEPVIKSPVDMNLGPAMGTTARMVPSTSPRHPAIKTPTIDTAGEQKPRASKKKAAPQKTSLGAYVVGGEINNGKLFIEMQGPPDVPADPEAKTPHTTPDTATALQTRVSSPTAFVPLHQSESRIRPGLAILTTTAVFSA